MKILVFVIFLVLCVGMNIAYTIFHQEKGYKGLLIKGSTILSCLMFALVCANLNSLTNSQPLLIVFGIACMLFSQAMSISEIDEEKPKMIVHGVLNGVAIACFGISCISLSNFSFLAILGGLSLGAGLGCAVCSIRKYKKWYQVFSVLFHWSGAGFLLGEGLYAIIASTHILSSILMLIGGVMILFNQIVRDFIPQKQKWDYVYNAIYVFSTIVIATSIFFF